LLLPFDSSNPITVHDSERRRRRLPIGSSGKSSSVFVVWPMMHTAAPDRSSLSENQRAARQLPSARLEVGVRGTGDVGGAVLGAADHAQILGSDRRD
jgi:hypothetical protein